MSANIKYLALRFQFLTTLLIPAWTHAEEASFPCDKATSIVELRICNSPYATLKKLDRELSTWYKRALRETQDVQALREDQREWLLSLKTCLTSETAETHPFVCDRFDDAIENTQCMRDFCLVGKYIDRTKLLHSMATQGLAGRYILSNHWPNGIHENIEYMSPEDTKLCKSIESALWTLGPLEYPLTVQKPISESLVQARVSWLPIAKSKLLANAQMLERLLRMKWNHGTDIVDSVEFSKQLHERIASGEVTISLAATPATVSALKQSEHKEISILRYQRWADVKQTTALDRYQQVEFFRVDNGDISTAQLIGNADDAFVIDGRLYFDDVTERGFNDKWESLPNPQPELFIYKAYWYDSAHTRLKTACHLLYEQRSNK